MNDLAPVSFRKGRGHEPRLSPAHVPGRHSGRFWTDAEQAVLREWYPKAGVTGCQARLPGRGQTAIYQQANKLGLPVGKTGGQRRRLDVPADIDERITAAWPLLDGKKRGAVNGLADELGVPRWWLSQRARRLHLSMPHRKEPPWTAAEDALMGRVPLHDPDRAADIFRQHGFGRSPTAIVVRAQRINLSRRYTDTLSARAAARIVGFDAKTLTAYCIDGSLKASRRGTRRTIQQGGDSWSITPADLRQFVIDQLDRIDFRKVDKFEIVRLLTAEGGGDAGPPAADEAAERGGS